MRSLLALLVVLCVSATAQAQTQTPVNLVVRPLFGAETFGAGQYGTLLIEAENRTAQPLTGHVIVSNATYGSRPVVREMPLHLPPGAKRRAIVSLFVLNGASVNAQYEASGRVLGRASVSAGYGGQEGIVVLSDSPRLRGALVDTHVMRAPDPYSGLTDFTVPVAAIEIDPQTGDPIVPNVAVGWTGVALVVASIPLVTRLPAREQGALVDWVRGGGLLVLVPRTDADLADPLVTSLLGELEIVPETDPNNIAWASAFVPPESASRTLRGASPLLRHELFGASRRVGFGRVFTLTFDAMAPGTAERPETKTLIASIVSPVRNMGTELSFLRIGSQADTLDDSYATMYGGSYNGAFGSLRPALDPNEGYKPALALVALLMLVYVFVVGPANFAFVGKRGKPILALVTTPIVAFVCLVMMLGLGFIGKGTRTRFRAVEMIEAIEGDSFATTRRYTGLFFATPRDLSIAEPPRGVHRLLLGPSTEPGRFIDEGGVTTLSEVRGRLWETRFLREDAIVDIGGGVTFRRANQRIAAVENHTSFRLRHAVIVDGGGAVYPVGDIEPGGVATTSSPPTDTVTVGMMGGGYYGMSPTANGYERALGIASGPQPDGMPDDVEQRTALLAGLVGRVGGGLATAAMPALIALLDAPDREIADTFSREYELRLIRVIPDLEVGVSATAVTEPVPDAAPATGLTEEQREMIEQLSGQMNGVAGTAGGTP